MTGREVVAVTAMLEPARLLAALGGLAFVSMWLAFLPPAAYLRQVRARAAAAAAVAG